MTSTSVKDVSSVLTNLAPAAANRASAMGQTGFQTVLNNQTQRNTESQTTDNRTSAGNSAAETKPGDSLKAKDADRVRPEAKEEVTPGDTGEEMTPEQLEEAMAVLETAAVEMIRQTADLLGIPVEEVQDLMETLGMEELDILDPGQLSALFLKASGVEEPYMLITDEQLYGDYRQLMGQLENVTQECAARLELEPEQMTAVLAKLQEQPVVQNREPVVEVLQEMDTTENDLPGMGQMTVQDNVGVDTRRDTGASGRDQGQKESGSEDRAQHGGNLFLQNLREEQFRPDVQQAAESTGASEMDRTEDIMRQIMDYMKVQLKADTSTLEMQLHPASLGTVQVQIASRGGALTANFITQNEAVKAALESQMTQLIERFDEQGVKVEAVEVTVQTHEFERNLDQGQGRGQQDGEPARRGRVRRINLGDAVSMDNMDEEDALTAELMAQSGSTVDYTA